MCKGGTLPERVWREYPVLWLQAFLKKHDNYI